MEAREIKIGPAIYELRHTCAGTRTRLELIREKLEAEAGKIDTGREEAI